APPFFGGCLSDQRQLGRFGSGILSAEPIIGRAASAARLSLIGDFPCPGFTQSRPSLTPEAPTTLAAFCPATASRRTAATLEFLLPSDWAVSRTRLDCFRPRPLAWERRSSWMTTRKNWPS